MSAQLTLLTSLDQPRAGITYLPHQEVGVRWMIERESHGGGVLADDMGLGKTFQTIGLLKNGRQLRTLIVCPPALMAGWTDELRACGFGVCLLEGGVWVGAATGALAPSAAPFVGATGANAPSAPERSERIAKAIGAATGAPAIQWVSLTTYTKLTRYERRIATNGFLRIILDEGHLIRNGPDTARWRAAMAVSEGAQCRWILSAAPVQNGKQDWDHLCQFLRATEGDSEPPLLLRRTMAELRVADGVDSLPAPPNYIQHALHICTDTPSADADEARVFRALCNRLEDAIDGASVEANAPTRSNISGLIVLELYLRIQQFIVHPQLYVEAMRRQGWLRSDWTGSATKWTAAMNVVRAAIADAVPTIVFCQFQLEMKMAAAAITAAGGVPFTIRGGADVGAAAAAVAAGRPVVVLVQIVAGGAGLNLQFCRRIVFLSQHWNPAVVHQAVGRAVRIGQRAVVDVHVFHIVDDVLTNLDHRMLALHRTKIACAQKVCSSLYEGYAPLAAEEEAFDALTGVTAALTGVTADDALAK